MKILLADSDAGPRDATASALRSDGYSVVVATDGIEALARWHADQPNVVVLDADLPELSGLEVCHRLRQDSRTPVILLAHAVDDDHVALGFGAGADDYVPKPCNPRELSMRLRAVWRRAAWRAESESMGQARHGSGSVAPELDQDLYEVRRLHADRPGRLPGMEFRLLHILARHAGRVVSRQRLAEYLWSNDLRSRSVLPAVVSRLRKKLRSSGLGTIRAVSGVGYRLTQEHLEHGPCTWAFEA